MSLALGAITVSGGGRGHGKGEPSRPGPASSYIREEGPRGSLKGSPELVTP